MADATPYRTEPKVRVTAEAAVAIGEVRQLASGLAGATAEQSVAHSAGERVDFRTEGTWVMPKGTGYALLDGGRAYWDYSNARVTFKRVNNARDFYLGRFVGDAASADDTCTVLLNAAPADDYDLARDPYYAVPVGTQALGGFLPPQRRGGALKLLLDATGEVQKVDALGKYGFATAANAIVEAGVEVVSLGSGSAPDLSVGIAGATSATDADGIAQHLFLHVDGNSSAIKFQSKDGTHTVAATDSTVTLTAGTRFEVWFDLRDPANVKVYVDGARVLSSTAFDVSAGGSAWKLLAHLEKTSAADTFEVDVDWLRARTAKQ